MAKTQKNMSGIYNGKLGESLFIKPLIDPLAASNISKKVVGFLDKIGKSGDDRSFVVLSASIIDDQLGEFLRSFIPKYELIEKEEMTLSMKIKLVRSLKFIPSNILSCADCVRRIRNNFAHKSELESLANISQEDKDTLVNFYLQYYDDPDFKKISTHDLFKEVSEIAINGIMWFTPNALALRQAIESDVFLKTLERDYEKKLSEFMDKIKQNHEIGIKDNGWKIQEFTLKPDESKSIDFSKDEDDESES